ncbi:MAG: glucoamylase [Nitrospirales bacterium]|nr:MAG: glucoamylase [Nitrospirales bacterium]
MSYQAIEDYSIIGDLHTVALVGMNGSIDFMCFPRFDSPTIFAALLDDEKGGYFRIDPQLEHGQPKQLYLTDTNILLTRKYSKHGVSEILDFMTIEHEEKVHDLIRRVKTVRGQVDYRMVCAPRFDYARVRHRIERVHDREVLITSEGPDSLRLRLHATVPLQVQDHDIVAEFTLSADEYAAFVMEAVHDEHEPAPLNDEFLSSALNETMNYWREWMSISQYQGRWRETVHRSALTLKLLTFEPTGAIIAAPTFGLPEEIGGSRNWDYRYTWIRDAAFTIYAFIRLGYTKEAQAFMKWIEARCDDLNPDGSLQVMYGLDGRKDLTESQLSHFEGYQHSSPVRIGNGAFNQIQLDIYGALLDSVYLYNKYAEPISIDLWHNLERLINWVCANWQSPDHGIWEFRGQTHQFLFSRLMCWVAVDRGIRLAQKRSFPAPLDRWLATRNDIFNEIISEFWDDSRQTFVQYKGSHTLDASILLMPLVKFVGPTDPRWLSTLRALEKDLVEDSLVYRYKEQEEIDGIAGSEGSFSMCSFWYVECLSRSGDLEKAQFFFEKIISYSNHTGLYAEELGPSTAHLGNFPQALTHLALISAAYDLDRRLG